MLKKRKIIYALISISILLIIGNILLENLYYDDDIIIVQELSKNEIEEIFLATLIDYGIISDWISKITPRNSISDSLKYFYKVKFPKDISIASFIKDVNASFVKQPVVIKSVEQRNYSNSEIKIFSNNILKLNAKLIHDRKIKRKYAEFGFIVKIDDQINDEVLDGLSKLYFNFTVAFIPSEFSSEVLDEIESDYIIILNDEINDSRFLLDEDYSKQRLVNTIKEIIITYGRKAVYLIDESSILYNSKIYSLIKEEFEKRGIKILPLNSVTILKAESEIQLKSLFEFYATSLKGKEGKTFFISYNDFLLLTPMIERQIKMGDKILSPKIQ